MRNAEHYIGSMKLHKAADLLEEALVYLDEDAQNLERYGDLHVEMLTMYGKVLKFEKDFEGAIDAFTAADEILEDREEDGICDDGSEGYAKLRKWRASMSKEMGETFKTG